MDQRNFRTKYCKMGKKTVLKSRFYLIFALSISIYIV